MPTLTLEGPRSDPRLAGLTEPVVPPPRTRVAPRPQLPQPAPAPVRVRRHGRSLLVLLLFAIAGATTGGALAYYGVELPIGSPEPPGARDALRAVRSSGDYTTAPYGDTVSVGVTVHDNCDIDFFDIFDCGSGRVEYSATGAISATVPLAAVGRFDVAVRGRSVQVELPSARLGDAWVDPAGVEVVDDDGYSRSDLADIDESEVVSEAAAKIERRARNAGITRDAQRAIRRLLVARLHAAGFRHAYVEFV